MSEPFMPNPAATTLIDVSSSSQAVLVGSGVSNVNQVRLMNNGTATVWVNFGNSAVTASLTTGFPVGPGVTEVLSVRSIDGVLYAAAIAAAATGKIYFTPGLGF